MTFLTSKTGVSLGPHRGNFLETQLQAQKQQQVTDGTEVEKSQKRSDWPENVKKKHTEEDYILIKYIFEIHLFDLNQWHLFPVGWNINIMVFKPDVTNYEWFWLRTGVQATNMSKTTQSKTDVGYIKP